MGPSDKNSVRRNWLYHWKAGMWGGEGCVSGASAGEASSVWSELALCEQLRILSCPSQQTLVPPTHWHPSAASSRTASKQPSSPQEVKSHIFQDMTFFFFPNWSLLKQKIISFRYLKLCRSLDADRVVKKLGDTENTVFGDNASIDKSLIQAGPKSSLLFLQLNFLFISS